MISRNYSEKISFITFFSHFFTNAPGLRIPAPNQYIVPWSQPSPHSKRHLDRFSCFGTTSARVSHTHTEKDRVFTHHSDRYLSDGPHFTLGLAQQLYHQVAVHRRSRVRRPILLAFLLHGRHKCFANDSVRYNHVRVTTIVVYAIANGRQSEEIRLKMRDLMLRYNGILGSSL